MKTAALAVALLFVASTAHAQNFRFYDNYGNTAYGQYGPYGGWAMNPYGGRAAWQNYMPYGYGYGAGYGYGNGYANGFGYGFGNGFGYSRYYPQMHFPGYQGTIPGLYTNGYFIPAW